MSSEISVLQELLGDLDELLDELLVSGFPAARAEVVGQLRRMASRFQGAGMAVAAQLLGGLSDALDGCRRSVSPDLSVVTEYYYKAAAYLEVAQRRLEAIRLRAQLGEVK